MNYLSNITAYILQSLLIVSLSITSLVQVQAQCWDWDWALSVAGNGEGIFGNGLEADGEGNFYVGGIFDTGTVVFDNFTLTNTNDNGGSNDIFLVKYNEDHQVIWAKQGGGGSDDRAEDMAVDPQGNIYLTGTFKSDSIVFDDVILYNTRTNNTGDIFLVKYTPEGKADWAIAGGGLNRDDGYNVAVDDSSFIYISGATFSPFFYIGDDTLFKFGGTAELYLVKVDTAGNIIWSVDGNGDNNFVITSGLQTGSVGGQISIAVTGTYNGSSMKLEDTVLNNSGGFTDFFLARYNSSGQLLWARNGGNSTNAFTNELWVDKHGDMIITGSYIGNSVVIGNDTVFNSGSAANIFLAKYNPAGQVEWATGSQGPSNDGVQSVITNDAGDIYLTGGFNSDTVWFDNHFLVKATAALPDHDIFLTRYDANGNALEAHRVGDAEIDVGYDLTLDQYGNVLMVGTFNSPTMDFGPNTITGTGVDLFLARFAEFNHLVKPVVSQITCFGDTDGMIGLDLPGGFSGFTYSWSTGATTDAIDGLTEDIYQVNVMDSSGCTAMHDVPISEPPLLVLESDVTPDNGSAQGAIDVTVTGGAPPYDYSWSNGAITEDITDLAADIYTLILTDDRGCTDTLEAMVGGVGIQTMPGSGDNIRIVPNPNAGKFYVSGLDFPAEHIQLFRVTGELLWEGSGLAGIPELTTGLYILKIDLPQRQVLRKVVVMADR